MVTRSAGVLLLHFRPGCGYYISGRGMVTTFPVGVWLLHRSGYGCYISGRGMVTTFPVGGLLQLLQWEYEYNSSGGRVVTFTQRVLVLRLRLTDGDFFCWCTSFSLPVDVL